jgi:glycosyltransferase involved in cell wall biosynthesis
MSYCANTTAVKHFYDNIFPIVRAKRPEARFVIVGADPPSSVRKLAEDPSVTVTGYVDDIRPYLAKASVAVCPMTVGVGIQNKVLEAMAMGKPVVATGKACLALSVVDGKDIVQAAKPDEFAGKVTELLGSLERRREIGENAARYVRENHDWDIISKRLVDIYQEATEVFEAKGACAAL